MHMHIILESVIVVNMFSRDKCMYNTYNNSL